MSIFERSITIRIRNALPRETLSFGSPSATDGPSPTASAASVGPGDTLEVSAENESGGCVGSFVLSGGTNVLFTVSYSHPSGPEATTVTAGAAIGYVWATDAPSYSGHDVTADLDLYQGVPANKSGGYAVPLELPGDGSNGNCQDFVNSLFGPSMRSAAQIESAYGNEARNGYVRPADFTGGQLAGFVKAWASQWLDGGDQRCPTQDAALLKVISAYIAGATAAGPLSLWLPQIAYKSGTSPSVFRLSGYRNLAFKSDKGSWNADTVTAFLTPLATGAHIVAISAAADLPDGTSMRSFDDAFTSAGLPTRHDPGSSHYRSKTPLNLTGTYYLDVASDFAPAGCGLILAFLVGRTVNDRSPAAGSYNTFIQLEGWQSVSARHNQDYDAYKATLWNISTFGACPYSEKRATTIFLAPPGWTPQVYQTTRMMPYVGAYATDPDDPKPQPWLDTAVVDIPADAPALSARYFVRG